MSPPLATLHCRCKGSRGCEGICTAHRLWAPAGRRGRLDRRRANWHCRMCMQSPYSSASPPELPPGPETSSRFEHLQVTEFCGQQDPLRGGLARRRVCRAHLCREELVYVLFRQVREGNLDFPFQLLHILCVRGGCRWSQFLSIHETRSSIEHYTA